jgi:hypothetical protein
MSSPSGKSGAESANTTVLRETQQSAVLGLDAGPQGKSSTSPESLIEIHWGGKVYTFSSPKDALKAGFHL